MKQARGSGLLGAKQRLSPNHDDRPPGVEISLLVLHSISLPRGQYEKGGGSSAIERLFCNQLDAAAHPSFAGLAGLRVSCHFLIYRDGELVQFVPVEKRAWHAGASRWRGRERCNEFSVGVELEGTDDTPFTASQYRTLVSLVKTLGNTLPLRAIAAHSDVAPVRKSDPGAKFDWPRLLAGLSNKI